MNRINNMDGMSLRDYFAGQAIAAWLSSYGDSNAHPASYETSEPLEVSARFAYALADAMLAERDR